MTIEERAEQLVTELFDKVSRCKTSRVAEVSTNLVITAMREAVAEEREACARVAEDPMTRFASAGERQTAAHIAAAIRGRGTT